MWSDYRLDHKEEALNCLKLLHFIFGGTAGYHDVVFAKLSKKDR